MSTQATLLLHACCGPCSTACVERLRAMDIEPVLYFANDNLASLDEYNRRLEALQSFATQTHTELHAKPYDHAAWLAAVQGLENEPEGGSRCSRCFRHNLAAASSFAQAHGFTAFSTTLSVSPHKRSSQLFEAGHAVEAPACPFTEHDFKKQNGFLRSTQLATQFGLYRQSFCGCEFSQAQAALRSRSGQAITELTIALLALLVVVGGLLQLTILAHADTETLAEATAIASDHAASSGSFADTFSPIRDWTPGRDNLHLTRDDVEVGGSLASIRGDVASRTAPAGDWSALDAAHDPAIRSFGERGSTAAFGFVHARVEKDVDVLPLSRTLFGLHRATTGNDVWMVKVSDLY